MNEIEPDQTTIKITKLVAKAKKHPMFPEYEKFQRLENDMSSQDSIQFGVEESCDDLRDFNSFLSSKGVKQMDLSFLDELDNDPADSNVESQHGGDSDRDNDSNSGDIAGKPLCTNQESHRISLQVNLAKQHPRFQEFEVFQRLAEGLSAEDWQFGNEDGAEDLKAFNSFLVSKGEQPVVLDFGNFATPEDDSVQQNHTEVQKIISLAQKHELFEEFIEQCPEELIMNNVLWS